MSASILLANAHHEHDGVWFAQCLRMLARYYEKHESLPPEKRGGLRAIRTLLSKDDVKRACRSWLAQQVAGTITPQGFAAAVNGTILPHLDISPRKPLGQRTACRWLYKLGYRHVQFRKGVYMDGHERPDVVKYRNDEFLPRMLELERRMTHFQGPQLIRQPPNLSEGEKEVITLYHDECCFHAYDFKKSGWCVLWSGTFVDCTKPTETLLLQDPKGWFHTPEERSLFVFDQSSAHASLAPDALRAWEMNKSNGGKQRIQKDTIIPMNNPIPALRGQIQKMTTDTGEAKGLEQTLRERGFNVDKMRAKCKPVCPFENEGCCMARLLSRQDDFVNQISMLEACITKAGHLCIFLPKFHCELNPIEMVCPRVSSLRLQAYCVSTVLGLGKVPVPG